ncbi:MAG: DUF2271 domain-containing protein [Spirochaetaceae bacterium]|jgi:hypothetical protein|nr:DUF2271 domain-containing protein [Spirochaetaceae bacterium]
MKKTFLVWFFVCVASALFAQTNKVEVNFTYTKQSGFASNQFAVWIEDAQGRHIKTLYATKFTAAGGWQKREFSLPLWVKQSNLAGMKKPQVDAITGSTPKSGDQRYVWDGTDSTGKAVPAGEYRVIVEGSLRNENSVIYTAVVKLGGEKGKVTAQARYTGTSTAERGMIGPVTVTY